jgi:hypothetical protein
LFIVSNDLFSGEIQIRNASKKTCQSPRAGISSEKLRG